MGPALHDDHRQQSQHPSHDTGRAAAGDAEHSVELHAAVQEHCTHLSS